MQRSEHNFYLFLEDFIRAKGITLYRLAKDAGVTSAALYKIKSGQNEPSYYLLSRIAQAYPDLNLRWLLTGEGEMLVGAEGGGAGRGVPMGAEPSPVGGDDGVHFSPYYNMDNNICPRRHELRRCATVHRIGAAISPTLRHLKY